MDDQASRSAERGRGLDWVIPCEDALGRPRQVGVLRRPCGVVLIAPPGESALLSPRALAALVQGLADEMTMLPRSLPASA